uniref:VaFE repeat-containing surface-anchored protein n=1 Tax=Bacillus thuringiensis TaxID=1428 RepID=UPI001642CF31
KGIKEGLLIDGKEVRGESKFIGKEKKGFVRLEFSFVGGEEEGREVVVFEELLDEGEVIGSEGDIKDVGERVGFVEGCIKRRVRNKGDGCKELDGCKT